MVERLSTIKVDASSVQGEGAYIEWKRLTWGERRELLTKYAALPEEQRGEFSREFLYSHLVSWNWVNGNKEIMPLPASQADEEKLYDEEVDFLYKIAGDALLGKLELTDERIKN
jgi:hypothetical protein